MYTAWAAITHPRAERKTSSDFFGDEDWEETETANLCVSFSPVKNQRLCNVTQHPVRESHFSGLTRQGGRRVYGP